MSERSEEFTFPNINIDDEAQDTTEPDDDKEYTREELLALAEAGEIKYTVKYIKKANHNTLQRIKRDYERKQLDDTNEFISDNLISKFSELMDSINMIEDSDDMQRELTNNKLVKRDLKKVVGRVTPHIPHVGLVCGGVIVGKHVISKNFNKSEAEQGDKENGKQKQQDQTEQGGE